MESNHQTENASNRHQEIENYTPRNFKIATKKDGLENPQILRQIPNNDGIENMSFPLWLNEFAFTRHHAVLGGGSNKKICSPDHWGNDPIWQAYFSDGLVQPPTRNSSYNPCYPFIFGQYGLYLQI